MMVEVRDGVGGGGGGGGGGWSGGGGFRGLKRPWSTAAV